MAGKWIFSCPDWRERLIEGRSLVPDLPLDKQLAARAVAAFDNLRLPDVPGQPLFADAAGDWFRDIVAAVFGSYDRAAKIRRVRDVFLLVPKKNAKTTNGAGLMVIALVLNRRPYARFGLFGPTQEISDIAFTAAQGMIAADTELQKFLHVQEHLKTITNLNTNATLKVTTFDPSVATGGKFAGWLLDEAHLLSKVSYAARVIGQLRGARVAIPEAFGVIITTQSDEPPAGAFKEELAFARGVRDGKNPSSGYLSVLYEFPDDIQRDKEKLWLDPALWPQVLPNLGLSVNLDILRDDLVNAKAKGGQELARWASQHLNIEIGVALRMDGWAGARYWQARGDRSLTLDVLIERCDVAVAGIDGGGLDDLLSLAIIGRDRVTRQWLHWQKSWVHLSGLQQRQSEISKYLDFQKEGDLWIVAEDEAEALRLVSGDTTLSGRPAPALPVDLDAIMLGGMTAAFADLADICSHLHEIGLLAHIGMDPAGVGLIVEALADKGLSTELPFLQAVSQGWQLQGSIKSLEVKCASGEFIHGGRAIMDWAVGNAKTELRGSALMITKQVSGTAKIDPIMATFDAAALMAKNPEPPQPKNAWEDDDHTLLVL